MFREMTRVLVVLFAAMLFFVVLDRNAVECNIADAKRMNNPAKIIETDFLEARYVRSILAWDYACNEERLNSQLRQRLMGAAYADMAEVQRLAPGYKESRSVFAQMNEARK